MAPPNWLSSQSQDESDFVAKAKRPSRLALKKNRGAAAAVAVDDGTDREDKKEDLKVFSRKKGGDRDADVDDEEKENMAPPRKLEKRKRKESMQVDSESEVEEEEEENDDDDVSLSEYEEDEEEDDDDEEEEEEEEEEEVEDASVSGSEEESQELSYGQRKRERAKLSKHSSQTQSSLSPGKSRPAPPKQKSLARLVNETAGKSTKRTRKARVDSDEAELALQEELGELCEEMIVWGNFRSKSGTHSTHTGSASMISGEVSEAPRKAARPQPPIPVLPPNQEDSEAKADQVQEEREEEEEQPKKDKRKPKAKAKANVIESSDGEDDDDDDDDDDGGGDGDEEEEEYKVEEEDAAPTQEQLESQRAANVAAVVGNLEMRVVRRPLMPSILTVKGAEAVLRAPFKSPCGAPSSQDLRRRLFMRKRFVPWGSKGLPPLPTSSQETGSASEEEGGEPLILWQSKPPRSEEDGDSDGDREDSDYAPAEVVEVDKMLTKWLRPHQREGVQFMFECVTGLRNFEGNGCILADDMGLGKTLQGLSLLWTLLKQGSKELGGKPVVKRAVIVCPTSLVGNWDAECDKWLKGKVKVLALAESKRDDVVMGIDCFLSRRCPYDVLIVSYETFRIHTKKFAKEGSLDLLICDEAHRLKNDATLTNQALGQLPCKRRVLLSGTPMQNHLDEFYAMVNFTNPGVLGTPSHFRRHFENPVLAGREPDATDKEIEKSNERSLELSTIVNEFILRRTNTILSKHLPPKTVEIVCCKMTQLQEDLYKHFLHSKVAKEMINKSGGKKSCKVLGAITALKKLCNHPKLIYDVIHSTVSDSAADGFADCAKFFQPGIFDNGRVGRGGMSPGWELFSGKFAVLSRLLAKLRPTRDRVVLISNYTQTLDLFVQLCRDRRWPYVRLDGSLAVKKRMRLVTDFNDPSQDQFIFLLSSKAGGCGLNLVGANRLVLFDPDWNPATDKQAAARCWRDGQKKNCYTYRFLATGSIEEKVYQRQISKEGLAGLVDGKSGKAKAQSTSTAALRALFKYNENSCSTTYDACKPAPRDEPWKQVGEPAEEQLGEWAHHMGDDLSKLPDEMMKEAACDDVSFVFSLDVVGKDQS